jgi:hypothetical protein
MGKIVRNIDQNSFFEVSAVSSHMSFVVPAGLFNICENSAKMHCGTRIYGLVQGLFGIAKKSVKLKFTSHQ